MADTVECLTGHGFLFLAFLFDARAYTYLKKENKKWKKKDRKNDKKLDSQNPTCPSLLST